MNLQHNLPGNRKGIGTIFGMIFFLVIVMIIFSSFIIILNKNTGVELTMSQSRQTALDQANEQLTITSQTNQDLYSVSGSSVTLNCVLANTGTIPVQVVRMWIQDITNPGIDSSPISDAEGSIGTGQVKQYTGTATFTTTVQSNDQFTFWFITARGNQFSLQSNDGIYGISSVVGSVVLNWANFKYYDFTEANLDPDPGTALPAPNYGMAIPNDHEVLIAATLINLDTQQRSITLTSASLISGTPIDTNGNPHSVFNAWISKVSGNTYNGRFDTSDSQILRYQVPTTVYFGIVSERDSGNIIPFNMVLVARYTDTGMVYGQNIPFVTLQFLSTVPTPTPSPTPSPTPTPPIPTPPANALNVILNPGFESAETWITSASNGGLATIQDNSWSHTGTYSGQTSSTGVAKNKNTEVALTQNLSPTTVSSIVDSLGSLSGYIHFDGPAASGTSSVELRIKASNGYVLSYYWGTQSQFSDSPTTKYYYMGGLNTMGDSFAFSQNLNQDWLAKWSTGETMQIDTIQLVSSGSSSGNSYNGQSINWDDLRLLYIP